MSILVDSKIVTVTVAGTAEQIMSSTAAQKFVKGATIIARSSNTGSVYVGQSDVDNTKAPLAAGQSISLGDIEVGGRDADIDLSKVYVDAGTSGDKVYVFYTWEG